MQEPLPEVMKEAAYPDIPFTERTMLIREGPLNLAVEVALPIPGVLIMSEPWYPGWEARVDGDLIFPPRGSAGFGYDPCFKPDGHARTFGEMTATEKHGLPADGSQALSHRARAFQALARACL